MLLDVAHRRVDPGPDVGRLGKGEQIVEARLGAQVQDAVGVVRGGFIDPTSPPGTAAGGFELASLGRKPNLGEAQED